MTKRLFAYLGLSMLGVYTAVYYFEYFGVCAVITAAVMILIYAVVAKKPAIQKSVCVFVAFVILISASLFTIYDGIHKEMSKEFDGKEVVLKATVIDEGQKRNGTYNYGLRTVSIDGQEKNIRVLLQSNYKLAADYGDEIKAGVILSRCDSDYHRAERFLYKAVSPDFDLECEITKAENKDVFYLPVFVRNKLSKACLSLMPSSVGETASAMVFGTRDELSGEINAIFTNTGMSFLIVISGLHMGIISMTLFFVLRPLGETKTGKAVRAVIMVLFLLFYMVMTGWTGSVVRSGIAVILMTVAAAINRKSDVYNSLGFAALVLLIINPYAVGDAGMLLSFSSVLGIAFLYPLLSVKMLRAYHKHRLRLLMEMERTNQRRRKTRFRFELFILKTAETGLKAILVSICAILGSLPVAVAAIGSVKPMTVLFSPFLVLLTAVIIVFTAAASVLYYVPFFGNFAYVLCFPADLAANLLLRVVRWLNSIPNMTFYADKRIACIWLVSTAVIIAATLLVKRSRRNFIAAALLSTLILATLCAVEYFTNMNTVTLNVLNTGGTTVSISGSGIEALLACDGKLSEINDICQKLRSSGGNVRTLVAGDDSLNGARLESAIIDRFDVKSILLYHSSRMPVDICDKAAMCEDYDEFFSSDDFVLDFGHGITDTVINDGKGTWQFVESGNKSFLIAPRAGDAMYPVKKGISADVLICSSELINIDELDYSQAIWTSSEPVPDNIFNPVILTDDWSFEIK